MTTRERAPGGLHALFQDAFNRGDVDALVSLYEDEAILIVGGERFTGPENLRAALASLVSAGGTMTLRTHSVEESPTGLALLHGDWVVQRTSGNQTTRGMSAEVARRQSDGRWLFVIDNPYISVK